MLVEGIGGSAPATPALLFGSLALSVGRPVGTSGTFCGRFGTVV
jgi:hypothetical protein